ncbi:hypothetical protein FHS36_002946 [Streptomyces eurocidicus]|uniref:Uncharacterized protein n=1 Tax=Streptomyces eurocidicus TaxID=66423 RepID=A0A7W8BAW8_STREU|nr:hypothetical protein [Streptomyces eurocidicus]
MLYGTYGSVGSRYRVALALSHALLSWFRTSSVPVRAVSRGL